LGLLPTIRACPFDLDGVLTGTATVHASAWKDTVDAPLRERAHRYGMTFTPFDVTGECLIVGVDRDGRANALLAPGADGVVADLLHGP